jgi:hypothetical protein
LSTERLRATPLRLYSGVRMTVMFPASSAPLRGEMTGGGVLPLGLMWDASRHLRVALEGGFLGGVTRRSDSFGPWYGGYGGFAVSYTWRR